LRGLRREAMTPRMPGRAAAATLAAALLAAAAGCGGGGSGQKIKPFLLSFVPATGVVATVNLFNSPNPIIEDQVTVGVTFDGMESRAPRRDGLVFDTATGTLGIVALPNTQRLSLAAVLSGAVAFAPAKALAPSAGSFFLVANSDSSELASVDAS